MMCIKFIESLLGRLNLGYLSNCTFPLSYSLSHCCTRKDLKNEWANLFASK